MFLTEFDSKQLLVLFPGRFQLPHLGHKAVYDHLVKTFKSPNTFIVTSDKVELPKSPFNFAEKKSLLALAGIPNDKVVQDPQPYRAVDLVAKYDAANTILLFAVSAKDMAEDPRFAFKLKKDGSQPYLQPFKSLDQCETPDKHGYLVTVPTFEFKVLGKPVQSASEIRSMFINGNDKVRKQIFMDLYGKFDPKAFALISSKLSSITEGITDWRNQSRPGFERIKNNLDLGPAEKEYLMLINDPDGPIFRASCYSFPKGRAAREQAADQVAKKYNIDPAILHNAEEQRMVSILQSRKGRLKEALVQGFGEMRPEQVRAEISALIDEMKQHAREGNMAAVAGYVRKLQPFLQAAQNNNE